MITKTKFIGYLVFFIFVLQGCIKDDFVNDTVDPVLRITANIDTLALGNTFQFEEIYLNNIGLEEQITVMWSSSDEAVISISNDGLATALELGSSIISIEYDDGTGLVLSDELLVHVGENTSISTQTFVGSIATTSSYLLEGDFTFSEAGSGVLLEFASNYQASTALPGLYIYLSNNRNSIANAFEIGAVETFNGAHSYDVSNIGINDYSYIVYFCKPFNVKVGDGVINE